MEQIFFTTKNDVRVRINNSTLMHMKAHPIPIELLGEAIAQAEPDNVHSWGGVIDMGRFMGYSNLVSAPAVGPDDEAMFARRHNRARASRTIVGAEPKSTNSITLIIGRFGPSCRTLISAWYGNLAKPEPVGIQAVRNLEFWCEHALRWDADQFVEEPYVSTWREVLNAKKASTEP